MIDKKRDGGTLFRIDVFVLLPPLLYQLLVKLDQEQCLILYICEQVIFSDQIEHIWTA